MPGYERFVAYIYLYEHGIRIKNTGFVKIHKRDGMCRVEIKLRGVSSSVLRGGKAYLFRRDKGQMLGTHVGDMRNASGAGVLVLQMPEEDVMGSGIPFGEMKGLYIQAGEDRAYAAEWDDLGIQVKQFSQESAKAEEEDARPFMEKADPVEEQNAVAENTAEEGGTAPVAIAQVPVKAGMEPQAEAEPVAEAEPMADREEKVELESEAEVKPEPESEPEPACMKEIPLSWNGMVEKFTQFPAFEDDEVRECIRIQPKDLAHLPRKEWGLGNNSFMLHGYYNYKYLLMGRKSERGRECIILGVPGVYHNQERAMAAMFGFPHFKSAKQEEQMQGVFGYWYRVVAMGK